MIDTILMAKELADLRPLRAAMENIHARASAALNNSFPDEAPEALAGICKVAGDALKPPMSKAAIEADAASLDLGHRELGRERPRVCAALCPEGRPATPAQASGDTSMPSELAMAWQCTECGGTGTITARFPTHPDRLFSQIWDQHEAHERKRHCVCPGHYLKFWPIKS